MIKCRWAYVCVYLGDNPIFCFWIAMKIVQTATKYTRGDSHIKNADDKEHKSDYIINSHMAKENILHAVISTRHQQRRMTNNFHHLQLKTEHLKRIIMSNVNGLSRRAFHRIAKYLFVIIQTHTVNSYLSHLVRLWRTMNTDMRSVWKRHLCHKQVHLYANIVTVRRKSRLHQTICSINNNDFVGMSINLN